MDQLGTFLGAVSKRLYQEDSIDRLNYRYTVWLLVGFALTLSAKQYVGEPIQCWVPAEFPGGWEQYTENYCFIENTYFVRFDENLPDDIGERQNREIAYYQWVPFILALEALMFYIPHLIWRLLNWQSGIYIRSIITTACQNQTGEDQKQAVEDIAGHLYASIEMHRLGMRTAMDSIVQCGRPRSVYLTIVYLFVKVLFIVNLIGQFLILNAFLGTAYTLWGAWILHDIVNQNDWQISGHFPRVTVCDFVVRKLGNNHRYTVQCVLMINMFSEKIFLFVWWWFMIVIIATAFSLFYWIFVIIIQSSRRSYVQQLLFGFATMDGHKVTPEEASNFADYIGHDIVLVLRLLGNNAGELMAGRVCKALYDKRAAYLKAKEEAAKKSKPQRPMSIEKISSA